MSNYICPICNEILVYVPINQGWYECDDCNYKIDEMVVDEECQKIEGILCD